MNPTTQRRATAFALALVGAMAVALTATPAQADAQGSDRRVTVYAAPQGRDGGRCDTRHPCSLKRAQEVVRSASHTKRDITVVLDGGTYRLAEPLRFDARDSGRGGHSVTWTAARGATPTFSGASKVMGWTRVSRASNVWAAPIPKAARLDSRQLHVDGKLATRARTEIPRDAVRLTADGIDLLTPSLSHLNGIQQQDRTEMEFVGSFTHRRSPVVQIADDHMTMAQPAWHNNTWGWDTAQGTFRAGPLYLVNARELLDEPGEWYLDQRAGKVYYQPLDGQDMNRVDVELPRLETLLEIGGTYAKPAHHLRFSGITFTGTTWLGPNTDEGYASQQTGAFLVGDDHERPADAFSSCSYGCRLFEGTRNTWHQMPAAVQVSAAHDVALTDNVYTGIGSVGVGIGNDANAHATGVGLGAADILVSRSRFSQHSGQAVVAGGVQPDAHHPSDPRMTNRDITITDNQVHDVSAEYKDGAGILFTYVTRASVTHNEVWDLPYSGINAGYGWGAHDPGAVRSTWSVGSTTSSPSTRHPPRSGTTTSRSTTFTTSSSR
nr:hypothetical protein [uncultured bacterium]